MKRKFGTLLVAIGMLCGAASLYQFEHYAIVNPTTPNEAIGFSVPENNHGHLFYITKFEDNLLFGLLLGSVTFAGLGGLLLKEP